MSDGISPMAMEWVRSSYSGPDGGQCVEWSPAFARAHQVVPVRDSKYPAGPVLMFSPEGWAGLVEFARNANA
ncbi:DUF397 domain-containing protein [Streptomyces sp. NBC_01481]|uniref:DUF397 domain-containing protein n=1 Tax=Streptomyces sp. NBC_01481 TaxID=2975869 RepID=UPI0022519FCF|nr:DUF397 domain-containing protein [Streptomyces sp. NBC_01481]MCX4582642.1 DUF397 domain-containing protein [Streptomyces sp. NBC_01481]